MSAWLAAIDAWPYWDAALVWMLFFVIMVWAIQQEPE